MKSLAYLMAEAFYCEGAAENITLHHMPYGSGFDNGTKFVREKSNPGKFVFETSFHHMDGNGFYCGWTDHTVTIESNFDGPTVTKVTGRNKRDIKEYIAEVFQQVISEQAYEPCFKDEYTAKRVAK